MIFAKITCRDFVISRREFEAVTWPEVVSYVHRVEYISANMDHGDAAALISVARTS
jgi:hypothetical protein